MFCKNPLISRGADESPSISPSSTVTGNFSFVNSIFPPIRIFHQSVVAPGPSVTCPIRAWIASTPFCSRIFLMASQNAFKSYGAQYKRQFATVSCCILAHGDEAVVPNSRHGRTVSIKIRLLMVHAVLWSRMGLAAAPANTCLAFSSQIAL